MSNDNCSDRVVESPIKVDLHIHSMYSKTKDGNELIGKGTIENLPVLVRKLNDFGVNMASITDHDYFSYSMYKEFKRHEGEGSLKKVLPGVEFTLGIRVEESEIKPVHVIAIFDDSDEEKLKRIETNILDLKDEKVQYDLKNEGMLSETKLIEILKKIGLDVVLIAHQKNSVKSETPAKNDLNSIGEEKLRVT